MVRKYHNHKLQTIPWHHEEVPHNNHDTPERQTKQSNQLYLPHQDDCKTRMDITGILCKGNNKLNIVVHFKYIDSVIE